MTGGGILWYDISRRDIWKRLAEHCSASLFHFFMWGFSDSSRCCSWGSSAIWKLIFRAVVIRSQREESSPNANQQQPAPHFLAVDDTFSFFNRIVMLLLKIAPVNPNFLYTKTIWSIWACKTVRFSLRNGPFCSPKWPVLQCQMTYFCNPLVISG